MKDKIIPIFTIVIFDIGGFRIRTFRIYRTYSIYKIFSIQRRIKLNAVACDK